MNANIAKFDLVSVRLAVLCADTKTLSAASKRACCSLSTASHRLTALEDAVGTQLFVRGRRGLKITESGEIFVRQARVILEHIHQLQTQFAYAGSPKLAFKSDIALSSPQRAAWHADVRSTPVRPAPRDDELECEPVQPSPGTAFPRAQPVVWKSLA
ncbi:regulatory protein LysR [Delftia sp. Cs1-4]|uniref:LysR family transcriptional regulator n=1 Tax=Delftia sp. (strain Cs1-4) TaxID=742013 RepID=UPI00020E797F|nr:LysR family transcriptional regulator [Delftia sp. Cs1-4]AEF88679.1 regulatory protein LysR [Delftia sp. Cs1-4]